MIRLHRELWTDGSVHPNPGPGGWAVVDHDLKLVCAGAAQFTTNIAMEGMAIIAAINTLAHRGGLIWTDSQFWVKAMYEWAPRWAAGGWRQPLNNVPMAQTMYELMNTYFDVKLEWLRGHNGNPGNEAADRFANEARRNGWEEAKRAEAKARAAHPSKKIRVVKED